MTINAAQAQSSAAVMTHAEVAAQMDGKLHQTSPRRTEAFLPSPTVQNHAANLSLLPDGTLACVWFGGTHGRHGRTSRPTCRGWRQGSASAWSAPVKLSDDPAQLRAEPGAVQRTPAARSGCSGPRRSSGNQDTALVRQATHLAPTAWPDLGSDRVHPVRGARGPWPVRAPADPVVQSTVARGCCRCSAASASPGTRKWSRRRRHPLRCVISSDAGKSWVAHARCAWLVPAAVHMNIVPLKASGRAGGALPQPLGRLQVLPAVLATDGRSWSGALSRPMLPNNNSSVQATVRLGDGRIAHRLQPRQRGRCRRTDRRSGLYDEIEGEEGCYAASRARPCPEPRRVAPPSGARRARRFDAGLSRADGGRSVRQR
jgi:predicted neuraminidase